MRPIVKCSRAGASGLAVIASGTAEFRADDGRMSSTRTKTPTQVKASGIFQWELVFVKVSARVGHRLHQELFHNMSFFNAGGPVV